MYLSTDIIEAEPSISYLEHKDVFDRLVPFWQLHLYFTRNGKPDFYGDVMEQMRCRPDAGRGNDSILNQFEFVKICCDVAQLDLMDFFDKWGFFRVGEIRVTMKKKLWIAVITCLAYCIDRELYRAIDYLKDQVKVLLEQQEKDKRILLNNTQRRRLAAKARRLMRKLLEETTVLFTAATVLGWYQKLIAQKSNCDTCLQSSSTIITQALFIKASAESSIPSTKGIPVRYSASNDLAAC